MINIEKCPLAPYIHERLDLFIESPRYRVEEYPGGVTVQRANGPPFIDRGATANAIAELITKTADTDCSGSCNDGLDKCIIMAEASQLLVRSLIGKVPRFELPKTKVQISTKKNKNGNS